MSLGDASVLLAVVSAGVFFGLLAYTVLATLTSVRSRGVFLGCILVASVIAAYVLWIRFGYDAVAASGPSALH